MAQNPKIYFVFLVLIRRAWVAPDISANWSPASTYVTVPLGGAEGDENERGEIGGLLHTFGECKGAVKKIASAEILDFV